MVQLFSVFWSSLVLSFWFFLVEGYLLPLMLNWFKSDISLTLEVNSEAYSEPFQTSKMEVFAQLVNGIWLLTIFAKRPILNVWQHCKFASEASNNFAEKAPSQIFGRVLNSPLWPLIIFAELNFVNITVLCTVTSTWPYFQHICWITKIIIVFSNHVFL